MPTTPLRDFIKSPWAQMPLQDIEALIHHNIDTLETNLQTEGGGICDPWNCSFCGTLCAAVCVGNVSAVDAVLARMKWLKPSRGKLHLMDVGFVLLVAAAMKNKEIFNLLLRHYVFPPKSSTDDILYTKSLLAEELIDAAEQSLVIFRHFLRLPAENLNPETVTKTALLLLLQFRSQTSELYTIQDHEGLMRLLCVSVREGKPDLTDILLELTLNFETPGFTPLSWIVSTPQFNSTDFALTKRLLESGADPTVRSPFTGRTPLDEMRSGRHTDTCICLKPDPETPCYHEDLLSDMEERVAVRRTLRGHAAAAMWKAVDKVLKGIPVDVENVGQYRRREEEKLFSEWDVPLFLSKFLFRNRMR